MRELGKTRFSRIQLVLTFIFSHICIFAQFNTSNFLIPTKTWTEGYNWAGFGGEYITWSYRYKIDTIPIELGGKNYMRLLKASSEFSEDWIETETLIRYEEGRVYTNASSFENDQIIYDFNLETGDTFQLSGDQIIHDLVVQEVDTVSMLNGQLVKKWLLQPQNDPSDPSTIIWIEGIGNLNGLLTNFLPWTSDAEWSTILCVHWEDTLIYDNPDYEPCWLMSTSTIEESKVNIIAIPNPASDLISFSGFGEEPEQILIYNSYGNLMHSGVETQIELDGFATGYYYAIVLLRDRNIKRIRFVKM